MDGFFDKNNLLKSVKENRDTLRGALSEAYRMEGVAKTLNKIAAGFQAKFHELPDSLGKEYWLNAEKHLRPSDYFALIYEASALDKSGHSVGSTLEFYNNVALLNERTALMPSTMDNQKAPPAPYKSDELMHRRRALHTIMQKVGKAGLVAVGVSGATKMLASKEFHEEYKAFINGIMGFSAGAVTVSVVEAYMSNSILTADRLTHAVDQALQEKANSISQAGTTSSRHK